MDRWIVTPFFKRVIDLPSCCHPQVNCRLGVDDSTMIYKFVSTYIAHAETVMEIYYTGTETRTRVAAWLRPAEELSKAKHPGFLDF